MKCAVKRKGFCPQAVRQLAEQGSQAVWAVVCLSNESCAIGDESPSTLKNYLTRQFQKYAQIYAALIDLKTGEVTPRSSLNRRYDNRLSDEVLKSEVKSEILRQLTCRLWRFLDDAKLHLWIADLEDQLETEADRLARKEAAKLRRAAERLEATRARARQTRLRQKVDLSDQIV